MCASFPSFHHPSHIIINRPSPSFRLNAPQAEESQVEESGALADLGDEVEDPPSEPFSSRRNNKRTTPDNHGNHGDSTRSQRSEQSSPSPPAPARVIGLPLNWAIAVGIFVIFILIGLIVAVLVTLGPSRRTNSNQAQQLPPRVEITLSDFQSLAILKIALIR
jgi:hypothetical protein